MEDRTETLICNDALYPETHICTRVCATHLPQSSLMDMERRLSVSINLILPRKARIGRAIQPSSSWYRWQSDMLLPLGTWMRASCTDQQKVVELLLEKS